MTEASLVIRGIDGSRLVEVHSRTRAVTANSDQTKRPRRFGRRPALERIVQDSGNKGTHADAAVGCFPAHACCKPVFKRYRRSHVCTA